MLAPLAFLIGPLRTVLLTDATTKTTRLAPEVASKTIFPFTVQHLYVITTSSSEGLQLFRSSGRKQSPPHWTLRP